MLQSITTFLQAQECNITAVIPNSWSINQDPPKCIEIHLYIQAITLKVNQQD